MPGTPRTIALVLLTSVGCKPEPTKDPRQTSANPEPPGGGISLVDRKEIGAARAKAIAEHELFRTKIKLGFGFHDDESMCVTPPPIDATAIDEDTALFVHDKATLGDAEGPFSLRTTLNTLASQAPASASATAQSIFLELWDTQNPAPGVGTGAHCNDTPSPTPGTGDGGLNGFPLSCRPADGAQASAAATAIDDYIPIALVNRIDLAHEGWRNCGEHRIVYGIDGGSGTHRNFVIFEAVLPNPKPGCRSACKPVMEFWAGLGAMSTSARQTALSRFFYEKNFLPGFAPVVHIDHYTAKGVGSTYGSSGSGQIRTNQFFEFPWVLKEFRLLLACAGEACDLDVVPTMVKVNPFGHLWNQATADGSGPFAALAAGFQADMMNASAAAVQQLASSTLDGISYPVDVQFDAAESDSLTGTAPDDYLDAFNASAPASGFHADLGAAAVAAGLTANQIVARATTQSCAGCHQPTAFGESPTKNLTSADAIGPVTLANGTTRTGWPDSLSFVHVGETPSSDGIYPISPALIDAFLPSRQANLAARLNEPTCACEQTFVSLDLPQRSAAIELQTAASDHELPLLERGRRAFEKQKIKPQSLKAAVKTWREIAKLVATTQQRIDAQILDGLKRANIAMAPLVSDHAVQPDRVVEVPADAGAVKDRKAAALVRRQHVLDQIAAEPARRTVSGSFRVH